MLFDSYKNAQEYTKDIIAIFVLVFWEIFILIFIIAELIYTATDNTSRLL